MKQRGITLIELLIALGVIATLAAIAVPAYQNYINRDRENVVSQNMEHLALAEEAYYYDNNTYLAGTYDPAGTDSLRSPLGWNPQGDNGQFVYKVVACNGKTIAECCTISASGFGGTVNPPAITRGIP